MADLFLDNALDKIFSVKNPAKIKSGFEHLIYFISDGKENVYPTLIHIHKYLQNYNNKSSLSMIKLLKKPFFEYWTKNNLVEQDADLLKFYFEYFNIPQQTELTSIFEKSFPNKFKKLNLSPKVASDLTSALQQFKLGDSSFLTDYIVSVEQFDRVTTKRILNQVNNSQGFNNELGIIHHVLLKSKNFRDYLKYKHFYSDPIYFKNYVNYHIDYANNQKYSQSDKNYIINDFAFRNIGGDYESSQNTKSIICFCYDIINNMHDYINTDELEPHLKTNFIINLNWLVSSNIPLFKKIRSKNNLDFVNDGFLHLIEFCEDKNQSLKINIENSIGIDEGDFSNQLQFIKKNLLHNMLNNNLSSNNNISKINKI